MKTLDFLIIGAQKSGTTTLFKHLSCHSSVYMPPEKEAPFFSLDDRYEKGWDWFIAEFFKNAPKDHLWGKASPQYMTDDRVPTRIAQLMPKVKLIAILRDPISRAYSHYKMLVRRGIEKRTFDEAIQQQLVPEELDAAHKHQVPQNCYVVWGEYGRILTSFLACFPKNQILMLFLDDLVSRPESVMLQLSNFLGISPKLPPDLHKRFHQGGIRQKMPHAKSIVKNTPLKLLWGCVQSRYKRQLRYWFDQWNVVPDEQDSLALSPVVLQALVAHYQADIELLQTLLKCPLPNWPFFTALQ